MSTSISNYYTRLLTLTRSLPRDPLRPTLQLSDAIESAVHRAVGINRSFNPSVRAAGVSDSSAGGSEVVGEVPLGTIDGIKLEAGGLKIMQEAVDGLEALKGDVAMKMVRTNRFSLFLQLFKTDLAIHPPQYPLSKRTLAPPSDPLYYTRLLQGVELSAQGKGRSWFKRFFSVKGEA